MLFRRLEHQYIWWCDFDRIFQRVDNDEKKVMKWENKEKREQELQAIKIYRKNVGENFENRLTENHDNLIQVKNECREIVECIHYKVDPSIEYYMEKSGILIDEDVKYFSWSESASLILKLRKEMIDEDMQEAESKITDYFEEKKAKDKYEKLFKDEEDKMLKSFKFTRTMNLYMKHCRFYIEYTKLVIR
jgi:hypothetical protein